jgi:hypothetical protein
MQGRFQVSKKFKLLGGAYYASQKTEMTIIDYWWSDSQNSQNSRIDRSPIFDIYFKLE